MQYCQFIQKPDLILLIFAYFRTLFIISDDHILIYSTETGEFVRQLDGVAGKKIIAIQCDSNNPKLLYGCTENGDIISWKWKSGVVNEKRFLRFYGGANAIVQTFSLIEMEDKSQTFGLVAYREKIRSNVKVGIFNLLTGVQEDVRLPLKLK